MNLETHIRQLARSRYWQELLLASKECSGIYLFDNRSNFTGIQYLFLYWIRVYSMLYKELAEKEWDNLDEDVLDDDLRTDAFLYYRNRENDKKIAHYKKEEKKSKINSKHRDKVTPHSIFTGAEKDNK